MFKVHTDTHTEGVASIQCPASASKIYRYGSNTQIYSSVTSHNIRVRPGSEEVKIAAGLHSQVNLHTHKHTNK